MTRRRWIQINGELVEVDLNHRQAPRTAPAVHGDIPEYTSPVSGLVIRGRRARRDDLARTNSRPWEGKAAEMKEAARQRAYAEQKADAKLEEATRRAYHSLNPDQRRILEGR